MIASFALATLLQCPSCFAPLPPPGSGHTTCRFCGATSVTHAPVQAATPNGPVHYQREVDRRMMLLMYEAAKKS